MSAVCVAGQQKGWYWLALCSIYFHALSLYELFSSFVAGYLYASYATLPQLARSLATPDLERTKRGVIGVPCAWDEGGRKGGRDPQGRRSFPLA